jgi:hypothetical protein
MLVFCGKDVKIRFMSVDIHVYTTNSSVHTRNMNPYPCARPVPLVRHFFNRDGVIDLGGVRL